MDIDSSDLLYGVLDLLGVRNCRDFHMALSEKREKIVTSFEL